MVFQDPAQLLTLEPDVTLIRLGRELPLVPNPYDITFPAATEILTLMSRRLDVVPLLDEVLWAPRRV